MTSDLNRLYRFTVVSRYPFPTDMLRYDQCYPVDTDTAINITNSLEHYAPSTRREYLLEGRLRFGPTIDRWKSFMFEVTEVEEVR